MAVTGTNGKSTTTRLIAHICERAGRRVGMTNSDGIYVRGELVEAGDWTGHGGAARVLAEGSLDVAVLETARGGILLRGIGYAANDVSVVTNVSADHLGLQGIDTVDELAEVKGTVVAITRRDGWAVLNADDPRVWAMRRRTRANLYAFSLEARSGMVEEALDAGGRAAVLERGWITLRGAGRRPRRLAEAAALPVTFAGLSRYNVANALAAAAACDALGLTTRQIVAGLRSFRLDEAANPGRLNLFERDGIYALVDFAHNEAGLAGLMDVARAVAGSHAVRLGYGTAGDRTDEILHRLGVIAGSADDLVIAEKRHYLRGRDLGEMNAILRDGAREGGYRGGIEAIAPRRLGALRTLLGRSSTGDVCAVMAHVERRRAASTWLEPSGLRAGGRSIVSPRWCADPDGRGSPGLPVVARVETPTTALSLRWRHRGAGAGAPSRSGWRDRRTPPPRRRRPPRRGPRASPRARRARSSTERDPPLLADRVDPGGDERRRAAPWPSAIVLVLAHDDLVEVPRRHAPELARCRRRADRRRLR